MDNLRWMIILVLFPYHALIIYSGVGSYYFHVTNNVLANAFLLFFAPWFMQLLFAIAGIATYYSLKKRDIGQYLKERVSKLLIPMVAGVVLVIPVSVYFGYLYNGYTGGFLSLWWDMMSHWLNYLGSGLLVGPLWFLLYLFIVSVVALPFILKHGKRNIPLEKATITKLLLLVFPLAIGSYFLPLYPEKSLLQFFLVFIFGYFFLSDDGVQQKLEDRRWPLFISFLVLTVVYVALTAGNIGSGAGAATTAASSSAMVGEFLIKLWTNLILWLGVLSILGMGKHHLEFKNSKTLYLSAVSFPIYIFHIAWINMLAYYLINWIPHLMGVQIILIMALSFVFTMATIEVVRRIPGIRSLFGMKG